MTSPNPGIVEPEEQRYLQTPACNLACRPVIMMTIRQSLIHWSIPANGLDYNCSGEPQNTLSANKQYNIMELLVVTCETMIWL